MAFDSNQFTVTFAQLTNQKTTFQLNNSVI